ncbi:MAG: nitrate/nitrite transporter NrtS [Thermoanaerobaculia bacterium]
MTAARAGATGGLRGALTRPVLARSLRASLVVGTLLTALNQGDLLLQGAFPAALWWKIPLTYLVPFLVATYGALGAAPRSPARGEVPSE